MKERTNYSHCPLCESPSISTYRISDCSKHPLYNSKLQSQITWKVCEKCAHVFTEGYFTPEACNIIFWKANEHQKVGANIEQGRSISSKMIEKVLPFISDGIWLDVGFGNASLLFTAQEFGFTPVGTDLRNENVEILKSVGIEAYCKELPELTLQDECSVISMADVLEHIPYPKEALRAANRLLKPSGVLLISMPNSESIVWAAMDNQNSNPYWGEIEHYHNFSKTRLYSLLSELGFTPKRYGISDRYRAGMEIVALKN